MKLGESNSTIKVVANPISGFEPVNFRKREQHLSQLFDYPLVTAGEIEQKIW